MNAWLAGDTVAEARRNHAVSHDHTQQELMARYWAPIDTPGAVDEHGFLHEEGSWGGRASAASLRTLADLRAEACMVLLGESGAGKSFELEREEKWQRAQGGLVQSLRFSSLGRGGLPFDRMLEGTDADLWRRGDVVFSLFLDGIDEAVETPERIADILSGLLRTERGDLKKLRLRITGRFATWSESMRRDLGSVCPSGTE